jgi:PHD/YefM family antitoxin component YafN of YafNO toxin-antitoxin module
MKTITASDARAKLHERVNSRGAGDVMLLGEGKKVVVS